MTNDAVSQSCANITTTNSTAKTNYTLNHEDRIFVETSKKLFKYTPNVKLIRHRNMRSYSFQFIYLEVVNKKLATTAHKKRPQESLNIWNGRELLVKTIQLT